MKISVSNIAWDHANLAEYLDLLSLNNCEGVEIAPGKIWHDPMKISIKDQIKIRDIAESFGIEVVGLHALLYGLQDIQMFSKNKNNIFLEYQKKLADICSNLGGKFMIFGSPDNRKLNGYSYAYCLEESKSIFYEIANYCRSKDIIFCIEPLLDSGCEFITSIREGGELVSNLSHPNFGLHIDTKTLNATGEDLDSIMVDFGKIIKHFHVSDPGLTALGFQNVNHGLYGKILQKHNYDGFISLEMRVCKSTPKQSLLNSINFMKEKYINEKAVDSRW